MHYYRGTGELLTDFRPDAKAVNEYISTIELFRINDILVDIDIFANRRWCCDRFKCKYHATSDHCGTCCGGGGIVSPYNEETIKLYLPDTYKYLTKQKQEILQRGDICQSKYQFNSVGGTCIFLSTLSEDYFCSLHKVALDHKIPVFSVKSFDCCIEPLEIIVLDDGGLFVTAITEKNGNIARWGNVLPCAIDPFQEAPLFIESMKYILIYLFGTEFYDILTHEIKSRKKTRRTL